jgi:hypothetical protein
MMLLVMNTNVLRPPFLAKGGLVPIGSWREIMGLYNGGMLVVSGACSLFPRFTTCFRFPIREYGPYYYSLYCSHSTNYGSRGHQE